MSTLILPILFPLFVLVVLLFVRSLKLARLIAVVGSTSLLGIAVYLLFLVVQHEIVVVQMGGWKAPFGISLVLDYFSAIMLLVASVLAVAISIYSTVFVGGAITNTRFYVFFFSLLMGVNGAFLTGDVFNLYVWFELMLLSSFVLISMEGKKEQLEGGIKYLAINLLGSLFFLAGLGLLYGKTGTLNMAHLAEILKNDQEALLMNTSAVLFFIAFGIKAAVFPLFFWLPSSYHVPNITVTSLFAGLLTKVGVYAIIRFFTLFFVQDQEFWHNLLLVVAGFTMVIGGMAASAHYETRKILSYHIISQIGYMIMGLGVFTPLAIAGAIYFTVHNMIAKTNIFLVAGIISKLKGTYYLKDVGGLFKEQPLLAVLFIVPAFALAGFPPLSGFFAKFILIKAGFENENYLITTVAVLTGLLTLYSMIKIWNEAFLKKQPLEAELQPYTNVKLNFWTVFPSVFLGLVSIGMGVFARTFFKLTMNAAEQLINTSTYIETILGGAKI